MPVFYLDVEEGSNIHRDPEGEKHPDLASAEREAAQVASLMSRDRLPHSKNHVISVHIRDEAGQHRASATVSMSVQRKLQFSS